MEDEVLETIEEESQLSRRGLLVRGGIAAAGLTANAVAPGWMHTPLAGNQIPDHMRLRGMRRLVRGRSAAEYVSFRWPRLR